MSNDLAKLLNDLIQKAEGMGDKKCSMAQELLRYDNKNPNAVAPPRSAASDCGFGCDPRNSYRELRRYLLDIGIDSRIFSFGTIPIPIAVTESRKSMPTVAVDIGSLDNCFFFEMRKVVESGSYGDKVNTLVIMFRVFFEGSQDSPTFWVQSVLNHYHDATYELEELYKKIIPSLKVAGWSQPTAGKEGARVTYFEKRFVNITDFKHEFNALNRQFRANGMRGNNLEPHS
jgi:hypothetical protein